MVNVIRFLQLCTLKITISALTSVIFAQIIWKRGNDIHCLKISDEFNYGGSA